MLYWSGYYITWLTFPFTLGWDMNVQTGKNVHKFILHNSSNRNGEYLTDFSLENRLTCLNTKFPKRKGKLWTYTYANTLEYWQTILWLRNGIITHWIARHIPLSRVCPPISELLRQAYNWVFEEMQPEQAQLHTMTGPCETSEKNIR